jgi:hypothetical protein
MESAAAVTAAAVTAAAVAAAAVTAAAVAAASLDRSTRQDGYEERAGSETQDDETTHRGLLCLAHDVGDTRPQARGPDARASSAVT